MHIQKLALVLGFLLMISLPVSATEVTFSHQAPDAASVFLAGEFNSWSDSANPMVNQDGTWLINMELEAGAYQYKFVVDGSWTADPGNPNVAEDGFGGSNSLVTVVAGTETMAAGDGEALAIAVVPAEPAANGDVAVTFQCEAPGAASVYVAGDFNGWSDSADLMDNNDGVWTKVLNLSVAQYQYKFVIDGNWTADSGNPDSAEDGFGGSNSVLKVPAGKSAINASAGGAATSGASASAAPKDDGSMRSVEFTYTPVISGIGSVFLAGSFNDWNDSKTKMLDADNDGTYTVTLLLAQGSYQYKFVVDGNWQADANNPNTAEDGFGGNNSLLEVDTSFSTIEIELGDGIIYSDDLEPVFDYSTCNPLTETSIVLTARAHLDDVEKLVVLSSLAGGPIQKNEMIPTEKDASFQYYTLTVNLNDASDVLSYVISYQDGEGIEYFGRLGMSEDANTPAFVYKAQDFPAFFTPDWAKDGVIYQIFPERFNNGDPGNDPDFTEKWYQGANELPASGKTNSEYFHLEDDWYNVKPLVRSPFRTDGRPDYFSFYGGDMAGIQQKLDYLVDLGITVIYFNPLNQGMSNHKYDPVDYLKVDPHFANEAEFKEFTNACHEVGIRIVVDVAFNHTGNWHFAFRDAVEKGPKSEYYNWYEFHRWPLPDNRDFNASDYYDCWWGFGLHPNLNFDLTRSNADENNIEDISGANPNMPVVEYCLSVADYWLGDLGIDGFRLDVPNEVPFWFWKLFRERCNEIKPDVWLVGELWGNAGRWINPNCFDSTMNYKFFRDPVMDFCGKGSIDAAAFDQRLSPGRFQYPPQSVAVMMNLMDSHDTIRFLTSSGSVNRLMLGAMFSMTYVGMPHIWYGDEIGMVGGKDPDCRRPMDWRYESAPRRLALRNYYGTIGRLRRDTEVLRRGRFVTLATEGKGYAYARVLDGELAVVCLNAGPNPVTLELSQKILSDLEQAGCDLKTKVIVGADNFPEAVGGNLTTGETIDLGTEGLSIVIPPLSGAILMN